jgi:predicted PurR-regulated permease PerM
MTKSTYNKVWILIPLLLIIALLVWYFQAIIAYIFISAVLSIIGRPIVELLMKIRFRKHFLPPGPCALITLLSFYLVIIVFVSTMLPLINRQAEIIANIDPNSISESLQKPLNDINIKLHKYHLISAQNSSIINYISDGLPKVINITNISDFLNSAVGFTGNIFVALFAISFITFFFLKDQQIFVNLILMFSPDNYVEKVKHILRDSKHLLTRYFVGLLVEMMLVSILISIGLSIIGVDNAILIGFICGVLIIIPYIGAIAGSVLGILIGISTNMGADFHAVIIPLMLKMGAIFLIVHTIDPIIFQPIIYARSVHAHPLEIFIVILVAGKIGGVPGMIVAVPAYTIFRIIAKEFFISFKIVGHLTRNI